MDTVLNRIKNSSSMHQALAFLGLILIFVVFSILSEYFFTFPNIISIFLSAVVIGTLALGGTFVMIAGEIDLSVGTGMTMFAVITGISMSEWGVSLPLGLLIGVLAGMFVGFLLGGSVVTLKVPSFISTLALMMIARGLALVFSDTKPVYFTEHPNFKNIAIGELIPGVPNAIIIFLLLALTSSIILRKTIVGRRLYALGSNEEASKLSGINVRKWKIIVFIIAGFFTSIAGILMAARLSSVQPTLGLGYELQAIAAIIIGGTALTGGRGTIIGTVIGALIMGTLQNGLKIMSVSQEWQYVFVGLVIVFAVYIDVLRSGKKE